MTLLVGLSFGRIWSVYRSKYKWNWNPPKAPRPRVAQIILIIMFWDLAAWIIIWEMWICMFIINNTKEIKYANGPGTPGPPNHNNYYTLGPNGLDYQFGKLNLFVYHWTCEGNCISKKSRDPGSPKPYLFVYSGAWRLGLSFWRIWFVCSSLKIQRESHIRKIPGPRVPQTILITILCDLVAWIITWENWFWM